MELQDAAHNSLCISLRTLEGTPSLYSHIYYIYIQFWSKVPKETGSLCNRLKAATCHIAARIQRSTSKWTKCQSHGSNQLQVPWFTSFNFQYPVAWFGNAQNRCVLIMFVQSISLLPGRMNLDQSNSCQVHPNSWTTPVDIAAVLAVRIHCLGWNQSQAY